MCRTIRFVIYENIWNAINESSKSNLQTMVEQLRGKVLASEKLGFNNFKCKKWQRVKQKNYYKFSLTKQLKNAVVVANWDVEHGVIAEGSSRGPTSDGRI